jgi:shikimate kinase
VAEPPPLPRGEVPHIILIGLPGSGKTSVGEALARALARPFIDFDAEIERREGRSVAEIFAADGESYFRRREADLTHELAARTGAVLSPGGGWILQPGLLELLRPPAVAVHLDVTPATAFHRMGAKVGNRPLLSGDDPASRVVALWQQRRSAYAKADHVVDTEGLTIQQVTQRILALIERPV